MDLADVARTNPSRYWGSKMKRRHIAKLIEIPGRDPFFIQSLDALVDRDIQSTPDNSNIQGKLGKSSSDREFELSRVKLYRKLSEGK